MGVFLALGLLMLKDLRTIFRRKASFIIELIILILTLVIIGLLCFVMHAKGSAGLPSKHYPIWTAADSKSYYVRMTNGFNITEEAYVINWLQRACPMYDFNGKKDQKDLLTTLWLKDFKVTGKPEEHRLYYEITGFDEVNFGLPASKVHGGIFGEPKDTYKDGDVKQEILFLQSCINRAFLEQHRGPDAAPIPLLATGTMPPATPGMFYMMIGTLMSMSILIVILLALREIATEKESGIHAYLLAVGLPRWTFFTSHYIFATVKTSVFFFVAFIIIAAFGKPILSIRIIYTVAVYAQVVIAFTMMIAALVKRNLYVTLATIAYVFMGTVLKNALSVTVFQQTKAMLFSFLHPGCALGFILEHFDKAESYNKPVRIFAGYNEYMPVAPPFIFMYLQYFFFMVMTYYIDYVVPTDDTPKLHPLFFFGLGKKEADEPDTEEKGESKEKEQNSRHEEIQATGELQLEVKDLVKKWPNGDVAVNKISFKVHSGQVVALLGHNGAGKSTTFSCLTGFLKPTSGTIKLVNGGRVGYCPQWDPLFTHLTVKEHLVFYCKLFTGSAPDQEVLETTLEKIELNNAAGTLAKNLSGGMKRKLSLGIALISSAKVVLLDEPTAGIDTFARRNMVKVIEKAKADHAVVITTHYMDEADALSDHINIMAHGEIICSGSSEFLKSKFGTGIMLVVDLDLSHREKMDVITKCANEILDVVKKSCPDAEFYGPVASQLSIVIGAKNRPAFPQLFADLESKSAELKIESFDVNMNSLDQVFVNVTKQSEGGEIKADEEIMKFIEKRKECDRGTFLFLTQIKALFIRKFHNFRRDYFQIGVVCVALFLIITSTIMKKAMKDDDEPVKTLNLSAKATAKLDPADFFKFNIELFPVGDENDIKSQMTSYLSSSYDIAAYENDDSEDIPGAYKKIQNSRWKVPTPTMFFLLNATVSLAMINPGFYHAEYLAQHMFFESFAPGLITGQITYKPVMWGPDSGVHPTFTPEDKKSKDQSIIILLLVYPLIFALPVFLYTTERVEGAVHLYARTHLTKFTYWVTSFLSEFVVFTTFSLVIAFVLFSSSFWHISCLGPFILITLLLSLAFIAQSYAASQIFNSSGVTFTMLMIWNLAIFMIMNLVIELIATKFEPIIYARFLMPSLALFTLFGRMDMHCSAKTTLETILECGEGCKLHPLALIGGCTAIHLAVFIGVLVYPRILACFTKKVNDTSTATDTPDVTKERERVEQGGVGKHAVVAIGLKKTFGLIWKKKTVVRNITFGVSKNECFGLLGSNGAGKSTTFNMLTASLRPTAGKAYVGGTSVANSPEFGFCPQKESILMELTVYETLLLFARLSGINETHEVAKLVMNCLQLSTRKDVLVRRCSGGEKRRVSIGVALITDPNILMLDEPTAGVDPHTRRFVWETLLTLKNTGASMILTSHSMEECEALCTRIAFLTGGNMIALGTSQHLKHTLGNEYVLTVSLTGPNEKLVEELNKRFKEAFEAEGENDATDINLRYIFKKKDQKMSVLYTKLDEIVASATETSSAANSNAPKTSSAQPSSNAVQPSSGAPSAEKTQPGTEGGGKKEKNGVRECIIVGATLEDIFIRLAQSGAPIPKAAFEK